MTIQEGNKLIAEFMGGEIRSGKKHEVVMMDGANGPFVCNRVSELKYHTSWDWLMPVVEKANKVNSEVQASLPKNHPHVDEDKSLDDPTGWRAWSYRYVRLSTNIEPVWKSCVQFILWYNTNNPKTPPHAK